MRISKYILAALLGALCLSAAEQSRRDIAALDSLAAVSDSADLAFVLAAEEKGEEHEEKAHRTP